MNNKKFSIIFNGEIQTGQSKENVQANLAKLFNVPNERIQTFFSGKPVVFKKDLSHAQALKYSQAFESTGAKVILKHQKDTNQNSAKNINPAIKRVDISEILSAFKGEVDPVNVNFGYRLSISLAALSILMLPLAYIGLIILVMYGIHYHAIENLTLFNMSSKLLALALYITPIVAGSILILFMFKPLFATFGKRPARVELDPLRYPAMYDYVRKICDTVKAPYPSTIIVDCEVNASASFKNGFSGMVSNELVLTIGLPLIAGLDIRTLTGILAHEFGHFSQGAAMRMTYIIYTVLYWLRVAVYDRDAMDNKLYKWGDSDNIYIAIIPQTSRLFIWCTRKILYYMMKLGDFINYSMSRQMEFDADRYETRVAGSQNFENTSIQITRLSIAANNVQEEQNDAWYQNQQLVDDLTAAIISEYHHQQKDMDKQVLEYINEGNTHWQDTHPCDKERIENAQQEQTEGIFNLTSPAADLITKIDKFSTELTLLHYRNAWNLPVIKSQLIPVEKFEDSKKAKQENYEALDCYFKEVFSVYVPVKLNYPIKVNEKTAEKIKQEWKKYLNIQNNAINIQHDNEYADRLNDKYIQAERANTVINAGIKVSPSDFGLTCHDKEKIPEEITTLKKKHEEAFAKVTTYCQTVFARMQMALAMSLVYPANNEDLALIASQSQLNSIVKCLNRINSVLLESKQLFLNSEKLDVLLLAADGDAEDTILKELSKAINQTANICRRHIIAIQDSLTNLPYPFEHSKENYQLSEHIFGYDIKNMSATNIAGYSEHVLGNLHTTQWRMMSLLCKYAEHVEKTTLI